MHKVLGPAGSEAILGAPYLHQDRPCFLPNQNMQAPHIIPLSPPTP